MQWYTIVRTIAQNNQIMLEILVRTAFLFVLPEDLILPAFTFICLVFQNAVKSGGGVRLSFCVNCINEQFGIEVMAEADS
jgi:hypothetical protein